jgi:hypothetical protein
VDASQGCLGIFTRAIRARRDEEPVHSLNAIDFVPSMNLADMSTKSLVSNCKGISFIFSEQL